MFAIKGIYKNGSIKPIQEIPINKNYIVEITFIKPLDNDIELEQFHDSLVKASESSTEFWYNNIDDKVWNNV